MTRPPVPLILIKALAVGVSFATLQGCEKYALDRQMAELCQKDGGVQIYETQKLPPTEFSEAGTPFPKYRKEALLVGLDARLGPDYRFVRREEVIEPGNPLKGDGQLIRLIEEVYRRSDKRLLGRAVSYARSGGDFLLIGHFSSASCPSPSPQLLTRVFVQQE